MIPWHYRNVINPWLTGREITGSVRFLDAMLRDHPDPSRLTRENEPDRVWS